VQPDNLHVTLRFLGSVTDERRSEVLALAAGLDGVVTTATVAEVTGYPRPERARAVVARLQVDERLHRWHEELVREWPTDEPLRAFDPHITLARARRPITVPRSEALEGLALELQAPAAYLSDTRAEGARYTRLQA
jgi:2'-5' RNA ligase